MKHAMESLRKHSEKENKAPTQKELFANYLTILETKETTKKQGAHKQWEDEKVLRLQSMSEARELKELDVQDREK